MGREEAQRKIKLFCPSVSKMIELVAWNEQRLDFGSIAGAFGLEPSTVKLNGHFVSRGMDLIASCVTWRSLLAFFSVKGLSTGQHDGDALIVDGKLSKVGAKRSHYHPQDTSCSSLPDHDVGLFRNKKLRDQNSGEATVSRSNGLSVKRKQLLQNGDSLKKQRLDIDANSDRSKIVAEPQRGVSSSGLSKTLKCSVINGGLKRTREDELLAAASCKRIR